MKRIGLLWTLALAAYPAAAQDADAVKIKQAAEDKVKAELGNVLVKAQMIGLEGGVMNNVAGAPYSGEQIREMTQTLGDGTRIHTESATKFYRDGQGRIRRETPDSITIFDPVAGEGYTLNPATMTATKMRIAISLKTGPNSVSYSASASSADGKFVQVYSGTKTAVGEGIAVPPPPPGGSVFFSASGPNLTRDVAVKDNVAYAISGARGGKREELGTQNMEGVIAQGTRNTHTIEAGEIGNDRPIQVVDERWYSPDLQLYVKTVHSDPRTGEETTSIVNIQRGEPDPSLFHVPAAYTITEPKPFPAMKLAPLGKDQ
jgi:hypothetical protein